MSYCFRVLPWICRLFRLPFRVCRLVLYRRLGCLRYYRALIWILWFGVLSLILLSAMIRLRVVLIYTSTTVLHPTTLTTLFLFHGLATVFWMSRRVCFTMVHIRVLVFMLAFTFRLALGFTAVMTLILILILFLFRLLTYYL